jgi:hypothetical protein
MVGLGYLWWPLSQLDKSQLQFQGLLSNSRGVQETPLAREIRRFQMCCMSLADPEIVQDRENRLAQAVDAAKVIAGGTTAEHRAARGYGVLMCVLNGFWGSDDVAEALLPGGQVKICDDATDAATATATVYSRLIRDAVEEDRRRGTSSLYLKAANLRGRGIPVHHVLEELDTEGYGVELVQLMHQAHEDVMDDMLRGFWRGRCTLIDRYAPSPRGAAQVMQKGGPAMGDGALSSCTVASPAM